MTLKLCFDYPIILRTVPYVLFIIKGCVPLLNKCYIDDRFKHWPVFSSSETVHHTVSSP